MHYLKEKFHCKGLTAADHCGRSVNLKNRKWELYNLKHWGEIQKGHGPSELWNNIKEYNSEAEGRDWQKKIFEEIMIEIFPQ